MLVCPTLEKFKCSEIEHDDLCLASQPNPNSSSGYICPNKLPSPYKSLSSCTSCLDCSIKSVPLFQRTLSPSHPQFSSSFIPSNIFSSPVSNNKSNKEVTSPTKKQRVMYDDDDDGGW